MAESKTPDPTPGRIVEYTLTEADAARILAERTPFGGYGNGSHPGDVVPLIVVRGLDERHVSGQAFVDAPQTLWVADAAEGDAPGEWHYPAKV